MPYARLVPGSMAEVEIFTCAMAADQKAGFCASTVTEVY